MLAQPSPSRWTSRVDDKEDKALGKDGFVRLTKTRQAFASYPGPVVVKLR